MFELWSYGLIRYELLPNHECLKENQVLSPWLKPIKNKTLCIKITKLIKNNFVFQ